MYLCRLGKGVCGQIVISRHKGIQQLYPAVYLIIGCIRIIIGKGTGSPIICPDCQAVTALKPRKDYL